MRSLSAFMAIVVGCSDEKRGTLDEGTDPRVKVLDPGCAGSAYGSIQSAIDAAGPGDAVEVCPGTWPERLEITQDLVLRSRDGAATTTIDGTWGGRGLSVRNGAVVSVTGFTFRSGTSSAIGGNVRCEDSDLELRESVLLDGEAAEGGGLGMIRCTGVIEGNVFLDNTADDAGGGLSVQGDVAVLGNTFQGNHAGRAGGGAWLREAVGEFADNTVLDNTSGDDGAGVYVYFGGPTVDGNTFQGNDTDDEGGGLRVKVADATITGNVFTENHADSHGGAILVSHREVSISGNSYIANSADETGGAIHLFESASVVREETYIGNTADQGGAIAVMEGWGGVRLEDSSFLGNSAHEGGHVYVALEGQTTTLLRVTMIGGSAERGGAVHATDSGLAVVNSLLESNVAESDGGALYLEGVTGRVTNVVLIGNDAESGSALRVEEGAQPLAVTGSVFTGNRNGAAVEVSGDEPSFAFDDFHGNDDDLAGVSDVIGEHGNLDLPPDFVDPATGDYALGPASGLRDAGDPAVLDADGTRCDIGLFGGPGAPPE